MTAVGAGVSVAALRVTLLTVAVASSFSNGAFVGNAVMSESPHGLGSTAVVFLVTRMSPETADFATEVARLPGFHVYVLPDQEPEGVDLTLRRLPEDDPGYTLTPLESESNGTQWRGKGSPVEILRVARAKCQWEGFTHAARGWHQMRYMDIILPLEKALYYFTRVDDSHDFVWMLEDDIFIPGPKSLYDVHVAHPLADFLGPQKPHRLRMDVKVDVQWKHNRIIGLLPEPRWKAHASGSRLSRRLLDIISVFASRHFQLQYVESMFATLAMQNNLNCEYDRIMKLGCCYNDPSYERLLAGARPGDTVQWWHPFKNISQHAEFRKQLFEDGYI